MTDIEGRHTTCNPGCSDPIHKCNQYKTSGKQTMTTYHYVKNRGKNSNPEGWPKKCQQ
jgi:hypothetical protein